MILKIQKLERKRKREGSKHLNDKENNETAITIDYSDDYSGSNSW